MEIQEVATRLFPIWWLVDDIADEEVTEKEDMIKRARICRDLIRDLQQDVIDSLETGEPYHVHD